MSKEKGQIGLEYLGYSKITAEPEAAHPTYDQTILELGAAVKAYLSVTTAKLREYGDNALKISADYFTEGLLDVDTLLNDPEVASVVYGASFTDGELTHLSTDEPPAGAVFYIQDILVQTNGVKTRMYRAVFLYKATASLSSFKDESDTRNGSLAFKHGLTSFVLATDNAMAWRSVKEFAVTEGKAGEALAQAKAWIKTKLGAAAA